MIIGEGDTEDEEDINLDEIDIKELEDMLDENLPDDLKEIKRPQYEERFKTVMEGKERWFFIQKKFVSLVL